MSRRKEAYPHFVCIPADPYTVNVSRATVSRQKGAYPHYVYIPADPYPVNVSKTLVSRRKGAYPHYVCIIVQPILILYLVPMCVDAKESINNMYALQVIFIQCLVCRGKETYLLKITF